MADLDQIVGAIFRDLAKSRVNSDLYSRNISRYYEQDPLLRRFPIPRTEIEEVDIDLRFAVNNLVTDSSNNENREASLATVMERMANAMTGQLIDLAQKQSWKDSGQQQIVSRMNATSFRIDSRQDLLLYLIRNHLNLISGEGELNRVAFMQGVQQTFRHSLNDSLQLEPAATEPVASILFSDAGRFTASLDGFCLQVRDAWKDADCNLDVIVGAHELSQLDPAVVSTVKIKATIRNYTWSQVDQKKNGRIMRSLNSE